MTPELESLVRDLRRLDGTLGRSDASHLARAMHRKWRRLVLARGALGAGVLALFLVLVLPPLRASPAAELRRPGFVPTCAPSERDERLALLSTNSTRSQAKSPDPRRSTGPVPPPMMRPLRR